MSLRYHTFIGLTGGGAALDGVKVPNITDTELAVGNNGSEIGFYIYNAASTATESEPNTIIQNDNLSGMGVWELASTIVNGISFLPVSSLTDTPGLFFRDSFSKVIAHIYWKVNNLTDEAQDTDVVLDVMKNGVPVAALDTRTETLTVAGVCATTGTTQLEIIAATGAMTLADGAVNGQKKAIVMTVDNGQATVTVAHHKSGDDTAFIFTAVDDIVIWEWYGTKWHTILEDIT